MKPGKEKKEVPRAFKFTWKCQRHFFFFFIGRSTIRVAASAARSSPAGV